jgi:hypothetical protein
VKQLAVGFAVAVALLGGLVLADDLPGEKEPAERVQQWQRDRRLIESLVEGGLRLAGEEDPLKRAEHCTALAGDFSRAIQQAAADKEGKRAANLGHQLHALLVRGVAGNLTRAQDLPPSAARPKAEDLQRVVARSAEVLRPAEEALKLPHNKEQAHMQEALSFVHQGWAEVQKAGKGKEPPPPNGKK